MEFSDSTGNEEVCLHSLQEIRCDLLDLMHLTENATDRLQRFEARINGVMEKIGDVAGCTALSSARYLLAEYQCVHEAIRTALAQIDAALNDPDDDLLPALHLSISAKIDIVQALRTLQGILGATLTSTDWQSPSFLSSGLSQAGTQTGRISGTMNDYKRDGHLDAEEFEKKFAQVYIQAPLPFLPNLYLTSSGMSAFTTIVNALLARLGPDEKLIAGSSCYFENKMLLVQLFGDRITFVDEDDTATFIQAIREHQPSVIFLDSLCNSPKVSMPDIPMIFKTLGNVLQKKCYLVLDNTGLAASFQPLHFMAKMFGKITLIVLESLNKYHQFGFDRVTGGVFWTSQLTDLNLGYYRMHLGTIIPDASVLSLSEPHRHLLDRRLARFERNALLIAHTLTAHGERLGARSPISHVVYPGLPGHPAYARTQDMSFHGSCMVLAFKSGYQRVHTYKKFLARAIEEATRHGVNLCAGTSFGFDTTRVYLTALHATNTETPFVRVSVGTECRYEAQRVAAALCRALDTL